ncbi:MAG: BlaI/MecI/CopY family transcriptional regulator [Clostridia bacterium]|nr:BlaI/MecI/CopY family transcriptional regulator [Clostridia bacterium]
MYLSKLPENEIIVMRIIWDNGKNINSDTIVAEFNKQKSWERPAILTILKRLERKGFVSCCKDGRHNVYNAVVTEKDYLEFESKIFLERICGNSLKKFVVTLYSNNNISKQDLEELKQFIEEEAE